MEIIFTSINVTVEWTYLATYKWPGGNKNRKHFIPVLWQLLLLQRIMEVHW